MTTRTDFWKLWRLAGTGATLFLVAGLACAAFYPGSISSASAEEMTAGDPLLHGQALWDEPVAAPTFALAQPPAEPEVEELSEEEWEYTLKRARPVRPKVRPVSKFRR